MLLSQMKKETSETCSWVSFLAEYIKLTKIESSFGAFKTSSTTNHDALSKGYCLHAERLLEEIEQRFLPFELHQSFCILFDLMILEENREQLSNATYEHFEIQCWQWRYDSLCDFDSKDV